MRRIGEDLGRDWLGSVSKVQGIRKRMINSGYSRLPVTASPGR